MALNRHSFIGFYPSDWLAGTARMTRMHKSIYFDVCCYIWDTAKPCPASELPLMLGDVPGWRDLITDLIEAGKLTRNEDGSLWNARALNEAEKALDLWKRKSSGGKRGAAKTNTPAGTPDITPAGTGDGTSPKMAGSPDAEPEPEPEPEEVDSTASTSRAAHASDGPTDLHALAAALARCAGVPNVSPSAILRNFQVVQEWTRDGVTRDDVEAEIDRLRLDKPDQRIASLAFFDQSVRARLSARDARKRRGGGTRSTGTAPPVPALRVQDQDDDRVRLIRKGLNGSHHSAPDMLALRLDDVGSLVVVCRSAWIASQVDRSTLEDLASRFLGSGDVQVRTQ